MNIPPMLRWAIEHQIEAEKAFNKAAKDLDFWHKVVEEQARHNDFGHRHVEAAFEFVKQGN